MKRRAFLRRIVVLPFFSAWLSSQAMASDGAQELRLQARAASRMEATGFGREVQSGRMHPHSLRLGSLSQDGRSSVVCVGTRADDHAARAHRAMRPARRFAGTAMSIFAGLGCFRLFISSMNVSLSIERLSRSLKRFSSPMVEETRP